MLGTYVDLKPDIVIGELPECFADSSLLRQVFINLLMNAVKFSRKCDNPRIEVNYYQRDDSEIVYFVKDNGVGFDMNFADKLFGVFQRLHDPDEFEGIGAGLSIVQRIIQRHDGSIWAHGEVGKGATFYFMLGTDKTNE